MQSTLRSQWVETFSHMLPPLAFSCARARASRGSAKFGIHLPSPRVNVSSRSARAVSLTLLTDLCNITLHITLSIALSVINNAA